MEVNATSTNNVASTIYASNTQAATTANTAAAAETKKDETTEAAVYEPSTEKTQYTPDKNKISQMINESEQKVNNFRKLIEGILRKQGEKSNQAFGSLKDFYASLEVDDATRIQAQEDISEDGYYGVEQTSQRILDFAKALSGGDPSKIEMLRGAVEKGFGAAASAWGGELPDISKKTYEAVMKGFDDWANEGKTDAAETAETAQAV